MDVLTSLKEATEALQDAHDELHLARERLHDAERRLAEAEARHVRAGLEGKNEQARKAELASLTASERGEVTDLEGLYRYAQLSLTRVELDYRYAREAAALHRAELLNRAPIAAD